MDRSSFSFKGSTYDLEKRLEFKAKLASKIEPPQPKELSPVDNTFNGVSPGGKLVHPSLGEGILVEVDHENNEIVIDFGTKGLIGLVLNQAKSFVHAPVKPVAKNIDDPFIGSEILRDKPNRPDVAYRHVEDFSKITSSDFILSEKTFIPVGSKVWHPNLGACTVLSYDEKLNNIVLESSHGNIDMVLSQVKSQLRIIETSPEHVPFNVFVSTPRAPQVPQYMSRGDISVSLPEVFKDWRRNQQFMYLTRNQHLSTEQANDVFSVLENKQPMFHVVSVSWQTQDETEKSVVSTPISVETFSENVYKFSDFGDKRFWHPDFGECSVVSADQKANELILKTSVGSVPFVLDVTVPKLAVIEATNKVEHTPRRPPSRMLVTTEPNQESIKKVEVSLPEAFVLWKTSDQYIFLTKTLLLTPEYANDVIAVTSGKPVHGNAEYEITWVD